MYFYVNQYIMILQLTYQLPKIKMETKKVKVNVVKSMVDIDNHKIL